MASSLLRGTILRRIRGLAAQTQSLRSLSSNGGHSTEPRLAAQTLSLRSLSSNGGHSTDPTEDQINFLASNGGHSTDPTEDQINSLASNGGHSTDPTEDQINSLASYVTTRIDKFIEFVMNYPLELVFGVERCLDSDSRFKTYSEAAKLRVMSRVTDVIQHFPEVNSIQIFHSKIYVRSMLNDDSKDDLTKDQIISRAVDVIQSYPKVGHYKVTEETLFFKDLGFDKWDFIEVLQALQVEFKLYIPDEVVSCKLAIEYIYNHRMERLCLEEFQKRFVLTTEFGETESEWRWIFVCDEEMGTDYTYLGIDYEPLDSTKCDC